MNVFHNQLLCNSRSESMMTSRLLMCSAHGVAAFAP
jgi:hypothetical protein